MIRFTLHDREKTISFVDHQRLVQCLIAACATEPESIEELLLAVEPYCNGTIAIVMQGLLQFDAKAAVHHSATDAESPWLAAHDVFEVIDDDTQTMADAAESDGIIFIDVERRDISGAVLLDTLSTEGTITLSGPTTPHQKVAFVLSERWSVNLLNSTQPRNRVTKGASYA